MQSNQEAARRFQDSMGRSTPTEKIAFNIEIERYDLNGVHPSIYLLSASQDTMARERAESLGYLSCHRVSLAAAK